MVSGGSTPSRPADAFLRLGGAFRWPGTSVWRQDRLQLDGKLRGTARWLGQRMVGEWGRHLVAALLGLTFAGFATVGWSGERPGDAEDEYLRGRGPYRGRVIDAKTRQPIPGAVIVAVWSYDVPAEVHMTSAVYDALEVLTDAQGNFAVEAPAIERQAPRGTRFPQFTIFKPGYLYFGGELAAPDVLAERHLRPLLAVVELTPNAGVGRAARSRNAPTLSPLLPYVRPEKLPNFLKALEEERQELLREP